MSLAEGGYVSSDDHQVSLAEGGYVQGGWVYQWSEYVRGGVPGSKVYPPPPLNMGPGTLHLVAATKTLAVGKWAVRILLECLLVLSRI